MISLIGKTAVICGSTQGIGKATALLMAELDAKVVLVARNEEKLKKTQSELRNPSLHEYLVADFTHPNELKNTIENWAESNHAHILVNNTGGPKGGPIINAETSEFTAAFSMHLICNHILVQALWNGMKKENYGRIINVISTSVK
ncbi:MAG: SDR family NAD(P)-dependent oxidoreductase, partial [Psychroflexus maritimus]